MMRNQCIGWITPIEDIYKYLNFLNKLFIHAKFIQIICSVIASFSLFAFGLRFLNKIKCTLGAEADSSSSSSSSSSAIPYIPPMRPSRSSPPTTPR